MKKITFLLIALIAGALAMQVNAAPGKAPMRSAIFNSLPSGFQQLGNTSIYYSITSRDAAGPGTQTGISILGEINGQYYSSTYEKNDEGLFSTTYREGAGFIAAFQVNNGTANYLNAASGTTLNNVRMTARIEPQGEVAARIIYTLTNNNNEAVTVNAGVWADIMIGDNDNAPLERLVHEGDTYGLKLKYSTAENAPLMCALFGEGVTGTTPADDLWFGQYRNNYQASEIVGNYDNMHEVPYTSWFQTYYEEEVDPYYLYENGDYDSGMGFCWKNRTIEAGESIELSYVISVGEIDFEEPFVPGEDIFTYTVWAEDIGDQWIDLSVAHPAHMTGYYEHPYGQEGYIEYQVDGGEWTAIDPSLTSGENYELTFPMNFDPDEANVHVLNLRFTDGLGNYTDLDGLSFIDVRSYDVTGFENRVYNGEPQEFDITVNGASQTYVGETNVGTYNFTIEGVYSGTIGIKNVEYSIVKAQTIINVVVPDDVEYDGEAHGATVTVLQGDGEVTITYVNTATGEILTSAPTEIGNYAVFVEVAGTDNYEGLPSTSYGDFSIYSNSTGVNEITVGNEDNGAWYTIDGRRVAAPTQRGIYIHNGKKYIVK